MFKENRNSILIGASSLFLIALLVTLFNKSKNEINQERIKQIKEKLDYYSPIKNEVFFKSDSIIVNIQTKNIFVGHKERDTIFCESIVFVIQDQIIKDESIKVNVFTKQDSLIESIFFDQEHIIRIISEPKTNPVYFDFRKYILNEMGSQTLIYYDFYFENTLKAIKFQGGPRSFNDLLINCSEECIGKIEGDVNLRLLIFFKSVISDYKPKNVQLNHLDYFINYPRCEKLTKVRALSDSLDHVK